MTQTQTTPWGKLARDLTRYEKADKIVGAFEELRHLPANEARENSHKQALELIQNMSCSSLEALYDLITRS